VTKIHGLYIPVQEMGKPQYKPKKPPKNSEKLRNKVDTIHNGVPLFTVFNTDAAFASFAHPKSVSLQE
jgi:hypothetical protein